MDKPDAKVSDPRDPPGQDQIGYHRKGQDDEIQLLLPRLQTAIDQKTEGKAHEIHGNPQLPPLQAQPALKQAPSDPEVPDDGQCKAAHDGVGVDPAAKQNGKAYLKQPDIKADRDKQGQCPLHIYCELPLWGWLIEL